MKQGGFAHILLIVVLVLGLAAAIYMVQQKTNIFPKASELSDSSVKVSQTMVPAPPTNLKGICNVFNDNTALAWVNWDPGDSQQALYFIRYRKPDGGWFPRFGYPGDEYSGGGSIETGYGMGAVPGQKFEKWGISTCSMPDRAVKYECGDFILGEPFSCPATPAPIITPNPRTYLVGTPRCEDPDSFSGINYNHMSLTLDGQVPVQNQDGIWTVIQDMKTGQGAIFSYGDRNQTRIRAVLNDKVVSIKGGGPVLKLYPDGRTYSVTVYNAPPSETIGVPGIILAHADFSANCPFTVSPPTAPAWTLQITPPPAPAD